MAYNRLARLASLYQSTLANRLGEFANHPRHTENETQARPLPHYGKIRKTEFSNGDLFTLLCKPPLERITSHFVILPRQIAFFFLAYVYTTNIPKAKKKQVYNLPIVYSLAPFFFSFGAIWAPGGRTGGVVVCFCWWLVISWEHIKVVSQRSRAIVSDDLGLSTPQ